MEPVEPDNVSEVGTEPEAAASESSTIDKLKAKQKSLLERVNQTRADLEERRKTSSTINIALSTFESDNTAGGAVLGGAVAFRVFLFMIPYVFVVITLVGGLAESSEDVSSEIDRSVGIGTLTADAIGSAADLSGWARAWSLGIGLFALFFAARTLVKVVWIVHLLVWRIPTPRKPNTTRMAVGFIGLTTVALALSGLAGRVRTETFVGGLATTLVADLAFAAAFLFIELRMPRPQETEWRDLLPGALLFGVGVFFLHLVTVYWISYTLDSKSDTYGAIGASLALLFWAYLLGRVITASIVINRVWQDQQSQPTVPLPPPPPLPGSASVSQARPMPPPPPPAPTSA